MLIQSYANSTCLWFFSSVVLLCCAAEQMFREVMRLRREMTVAKLVSSSQTRARGLERAGLHQHAAGP